MDLRDGTLEFAGGQLRWDGEELTIGNSSNDTGSTKINGGCLKTGNIVSQNYNVPAGKGVLDNIAGSILCLNDGKFNFGGGKLKWDGTNLTINGSGTFTGTVSAGTITGATISGGTISGTIINGTTIRGTDISGGTVSGTTFTGGSITCNDVNIKGDIDAQNLSVKDSISLWTSGYGQNINIETLKMTSLEENYLSLIIGKPYMENVGMITDPNSGMIEYPVRFYSVKIPSMLEVEEAIFIPSGGYLSVPDLIVREGSVCFENLPTNTSSANVRVGTKEPIGKIYRVSSSSKRYKNSIIPISESVELNPGKLYDIDVVSFKYNDEYLPSTDQRYQKEIPGLIAENIHEKYPIACNLDNDGKPEMWEINILFPAALKLIQDQHKEIEQLKKRVCILEHANQ